MFPTIERAPRRSRYSSATWYPAAGLAGLRRRRVLVDFDAVLRAATDPAASNSATRVSPRSTLTNTCFFNAHSVLYVSLGKFAKGARALRARSSGRTRAARPLSGAAVMTKPDLGSSSRQSCVLAHILTVEGRSR